MASTLSPPERAFGDLLDVLRPAVQAKPLLSPLGVKLESELGGDHDLPFEGGERFAHEFLVVEGAIDFGGIEEGDAAFDGSMDERNHLLLVCGRTVGESHAHAAEAEGGDLEPTFSEFALLHGLVLPGCQPGI